MPLTAGIECGLPATQGRAALPRCWTAGSPRARTFFVGHDILPDEGSYLVAMLWAMGRARVIVSNSMSNIGALLLTFSIFRTEWQATPHFIDLDAKLSPSDVASGRFFCEVAYGSRALCGGDVVAERKQIRNAHILAPFSKKKGSGSCAEREHLSFISTPQALWGRHRHKLSRWADALRSAAAGRDLVPCRRLSHLTSSRLANEWEVCLDRPAHEKEAYRISSWAECLAFSIGIGNHWEFEDALVSKGCEVHAFDPTLTLLEKHHRHVRNASSLLQFHYVGLGNNGSRMYQGMYGSISSDASMMQLDEMFQRFAGNRHVTVLKIDCEGCEWAAFRHIIAHAPRLLQYVRTINLEIHLSTSLQMSDPNDVGVLFRHLIDDHGFGFHRARVRCGAARDRNQVHPILVSAGFGRLPCCFELMFIRKTPPSVSGMASLGRTDRRAG